MFCGNLLYTREECADEEQRHRDVNEANKMLDEGKTLGEINSKLHIWYEFPEHLEHVNKDNCFPIEHWGNRDNLIYKITGIKFSGGIIVYGYCNKNLNFNDELYLQINDYILRNPRPKEEFICYKK